MGGACSTFGERRGVHRILVGNLREIYHLGDPVENGRIILRWIIMKWDREWNGLIWPWKGTGGGHL